MGKNIMKWIKPAGVSKFHAINEEDKEHETLCGRYFALDNRAKESNENDPLACEECRNTHK